MAKHLPFEEAIGSLPDSFFVLDPEWRCVYVNDAGLRLVGRTRQELIGRTFYEVFPELKGQPFVEPIEKAMRERKPLRFETYNDVWDRYFENQVTPFGDGVAVISRDVTDRVRALRDLEDSERRVTEILESIGDGFVSIGPDWRYIYVNRRAAQMLGRTCEELVGHSYRDVFPEAIGTPFERECARVMETAEPAAFEDHFEPWDRWFEHRIYPLAGGGIVVYFTEITERKHLEQALRENEAMFRALVENSSELITASDPDVPATIYVSPSVERILGYPPEELLAMESLAPLFHPDDWEALKEASARALRGDLGGASLLRMIRKDGSMVWVESTVGWVVDGVGRRLIVRNSHDVTERVLAEEAAEQRAEQVEHEALRLEGLNRLSKAILTAATAEEIAAVALDHVGVLVGFDRAAVWEMSPDGRTLRFLSVTDPGDPSPRPGDVFPAEALGPAKGLLRDGVVHVQDLEVAADRGPLVDAWIEAGCRSLIGVRLSTEDSVLGGLTVLRKETGGFEEEDLEILEEVGSQLSIGMRQARMTQSLAERAARLEGMAAERGRLLEGLVGAQEEERARVARELHDGLGQTLTSLGMLAADLSRGAREPGVKEELARFKELLDAAALETRHMVAGLKPVELELGLGPAIERLLALATEGTGIQPGLADDTSGRRYPDAVEATVFRVVQEAVNNAVKHSTPSSVSVVLAERGGRLSAIVEDDGAGFYPGEAHEGYGLLGMRERAAIVGGELTVESSAGTGTTVRLEVPV